jgi:hypothetical protein
MIAETIGRGTASLIFGKSEAHVASKKLLSIRKFAEGVHTQSGDRPHRTVICGIHPGDPASSSSSIHGLHGSVSSIREEERGRGSQQQHWAGCRSVRWASHRPLRPPPAAGCPSADRPTASSATPSCNVPRLRNHVAKSTQAEDEQQLAAKEAQ